MAEEGRKASMVVDAVISLADSGTAAEVADISDNTTQYAILAENQRKKRALAVAKQKVEQLLNENRVLLEERETTREEQYVATEFLRKRLLASNERVAELEQKFQSAQARFQSELSAHVETSKQTIQDLTEDWRAKEKMLRATIAAQEKELINVKQFQEARAEFDKEMDMMRVRDEERRLQNELQTAELERKFIEQHTRLKRDYDLRLEDLKRAADEDIDEKLDASVKRILQQNRRMAEELRMHVKETDELQRQMARMEMANRKMEREVQLKSQMEEEYARRGSRQSRDMSKTMSKVQSLQNSLTRVMRDKEEERAVMARTQREEVDAMQAENESLRQQLRMRNREMRTLRELSKNVVDQRSELEQFFIDSLEVVKEEMAREAAAQQQQQQGQGRGRHAGAGAGAGATRRRASARGFAKLSPLPGVRHGAPPPSRGVSTSSPAAASYRGHISITVTNSSEQGVDLRSLTWPQRERVLNVLFARINSTGAGRAPPGGKSSPHPKAAAAAGRGGAAGAPIDILHPLNLDGTSPSLNDGDSDRKYVNGRVGVSVTPRSRDSALLELEALNADAAAGSRVQSVGRRAELA